MIFHRFPLPNWSWQVAGRRWGSRVRTATWLYLVPGWRHCIEYLMWGSIIDLIFAVFFAHVSRCQFHSQSAWQDHGIRSFSALPPKSLWIGWGDLHQEPSIDSTHFYTSEKIWKNNDFLWVSPWNPAINNLRLQWRPFRGDSRKRPDGLWRLASLLDVWRWCTTCLAALGGVQHFRHLEHSSRCVSVCFSELRHELSNQLTRYARHSSFSVGHRRVMTPTYSHYARLAVIQARPRDSRSVLYHDAVPKSHNISNKNSVFPTLMLMEADSILNWGIHPYDKLCALAVEERKNQRQPDSTEFQICRFEPIQPPHSLMFRCNGLQLHTFCLIKCYRHLSPN